MQFLTIKTRSFTSSLNSNYGKALSQDLTVFCFCIFLFLFSLIFEANTYSIAEKSPFVNLNYKIKHDVSGY